MTPSLRACRLAIAAAACAFAAGAAHSQTESNPGAAADGIVFAEELFPQIGTALSQAVSQSPRMIGQAYALEAADGNYTQARAGLYPTVRVNAQAVLAHDEREDVADALSTEKFYYGLNISQPLFHWGERRNRARIGEIEKTIAERDYGETYRLLALDIRSAWLGAIVDGVRLRAAKLNQSIQEKALAQAEDRVRAGTTAERDLFGNLQSVEQARLATDRLELSVGQSLRGIRILTGGIGPEPATMPGEIPPVAGMQPAIESLLARYLSSGDMDTPGLRTLRDQLEAARLAYDNERTRLRPKFNLIAGVTQDQQSYTVNIGAKYGVLSEYAGVQLEWPVFDGFAARGATQSALARVRGLELGVARSADALAHDAQIRAREVQLIERQMALQERSFERETENRATAREQFDRGEISEDSLTQSELNWLNAAAATYGMRAAYLHAVADFVSTIGFDPAAAAKPPPDERKGR